MLIAGAVIFAILSVIVHVLIIRVSLEHGVGSAACNNAQVLARIQQLIVADRIDRAIKLCTVAPNCFFLSMCKDLLTQVQQPGCTFEALDQLAARRLQQIDTWRKQYLRGLRLYLVWMVFLAAVGTFFSAKAEGEWWVLGPTLLSMLVHGGQLSRYFVARTRAFESHDAAPTDIAVLVDFLRGRVAQ